MRHLTELDRSMNQTYRPGAQPDSPLVSCIMPTCNRREFVPRAIDYFLRQDYPNRELIVVDDGSDPVADLLPGDARIRYVRTPGRATVGAKRNLACQQAQGELILHWDDDDWHAPGRISAQVTALLEQNAEVCGLRQMLFYDPRSGAAWLYEYPARERRWLIGGSLLYRRRFWERAPFPNIQVGEDTRFIWSQALDRAVTMRDYSFYVALIHPANTSPKETSTPYWRRWDGDLRAVMGSDLDRYSSPGNGHHPAAASNTTTPVPVIQPASADLPVEHLPRQPIKNPLPPAPAPLDQPASAAVLAGGKIHPGNLPAAAPRVSCILATGNRPAFTRQAIRCFLRQSLEDSELIVVDDGAEPVEDLCSGLLRVRYLRLRQPTSLGAKLNLGIRQARGAILQKLDDDDYYHPSFLEQAVSNLNGGRSSSFADQIVAWDCFLVLLSGSPELRFSGHGWAAGGTLCFHRSLWEQAPFRDLPREVDAWFLRDHAMAIRRVCAPEMYILLRHGANTWTETNRVNVDAFFASRPADRRALESLVEPLDWAFYRDIAGTGQNGAEREV